MQEKAEGILLPKNGAGKDRYNCCLQLHRGKVRLRLTAKEQEPVVTVQREILMRYDENICMVRKVLEHIAQRGCGIYIHGDAQNLTG